MGIEYFSIPPQEDESKRVDDPAKAEEMAHESESVRGLLKDKDDDEENWVLGSGDTYGGAALVGKKAEVIDMAEEHAGENYDKKEHKE